MDLENDLRLTRHEWETLKTIGGVHRDCHGLDDAAISALVASDGAPRRRARLAAALEFLLKDLNFS